MAAQHHGPVDPMRRAEDIFSNDMMNAATPKGGENSGRPDPGDAW